MISSDIQDNSKLTIIKDLDSVVTLLIIAQPVTNPNHRKIHPLDHPSYEQILQ